MKRIGSDIWFDKWTLPIFGVFAVIITMDLLLPTHIETGIVQSKYIHHRGWWEKGGDQFYVDLGHHQEVLSKDTYNLVKPGDSLVLNETALLGMIKSVSIYRNDALVTATDETRNIMIGIFILAVLSILVIIKIRKLAKNAP